MIVLNALTAVIADQGVYQSVYIAIFRWIVPVLALLLLVRCIRPLMTFRREPEIWAWLCLEDGRKLAVTHWENVIGRSKRSDIVIDFPTVSRTHSVLTRYDDGTWSLSDVDSMSGTLVNGEPIDICALYPEDVINIGGVEMVLQPVTKRQEQKLAQIRTKASTVGAGIANLLLLTVFQLLTCLAFLLGSQPELYKTLLTGFGGIAAVQWGLFLFYLCIRRTAYELETVAFFLTTLGMAVIATVAPDETTKQLIALGLGIVAFLLVGWGLRTLKRAKVLRMIAAIAGIAFLVITLAFGQEYYGAKNWLVIGPMSLQPSELSKVCFVFVGASALERIVTKRNLFGFIVYSAAICGCLALMNDFGTALIFFCAFLVIAYMRSGNVGTLALALSSLGFAGVLALRVAPHALRRFNSWRHIWEVPLDAGYQQTRALMCMASGGLMGLGVGCGWMKNVFAADSDMAVATLSEEWGLIMLLLAIVSIVAMAAFAVRTAAVARSSFYTIGACTAASILLVQVILNALGTVDVIPLTGVTFPFLSNGGSSMICAWGLLAFIKAADTRQNASFAVRLPDLRRMWEDE